MPRATANTRSVKDEPLDIRHVIDVAPYEGVLLQEMLKKPGTLTSSKVWLVLDGDTLLWFDKSPASDKELWCLEVTEKHRLLLGHLSISLKSGADFEIYSADLGAKPMAIRCRDQEAAVAWVDAIDRAKQAAAASLKDSKDQWLAHLNSCVASGCTHEKFCCGFCRPHFRLYFGEEPEVEAARLSQQRGAKSTTYRVELHHLVLPRNVGKLGFELCEDDSLVANLADKGLADRYGLQLRDKLVGINGFAVTCHSQACPSTAFHGHPWPSKGLPLIFH